MLCFYSYYFSCCVKSDRYKTWGSAAGGANGGWGNLKISCSSSPKLTQPPLVVSCTRRNALSASKTSETTLYAPPGKVALRATYGQAPNPHGGRLESVGYVVDGSTVSGGPCVLGCAVPPSVPVSEGAAEADQVCEAEVEGVDSGVCITLEDETH